jgi:hypothetical protein
MSEDAMKKLVLIGAVAALGLSATPASAEAPWCAVSSGRDSFENCGYFTHRQCLTAMSGVGGYCFPNPRPPGYFADSFEVRRWKKGRLPF